MKFKLITIAVMVTMVLTACGSNPNQKSNAEVALQMTQSNNQVTLKQVELMIEREKTSQKELEAQSNFAKAMETIGSGGDAHSKVVATVALLGAVKSGGTGKVQTQGNDVPKAAPNVMPSPERDGLDRTLQVLSVLAPGGIPALAAPVLGFLSNKEHEITNRVAAEFSFKGQQAQWNGLQGIVGTLGQPSYTWNVGGDYAGRDLVGRYSGQGSGASGVQNFGSGTLNQGAGARFTSPGPYVQPTCSPGYTSTTGANGSVTCTATNNE